VTRKQQPNTSSTQGHSAGQPQWSRRGFGKAVAQAGAVVLGASCARPVGSPQATSKAGDPASQNTESAASPTTTPPSDATALVALGRSGLHVPRLAMGTGTNGWGRVSDQTRLGREGFVRLMRYGIERGARFVDAADLYGSHEYTKALLREVPRDSLTVLSKVWFKPGAPNMQPTDTARPEVERFLREMGTDYLDMAMVHCVTDPAWPSRQARMVDELSELKERGMVRSVGCSCHSHAALRVAAELPWVDVIMARINPGHKRMDEDASVETVAETLKLARHNGKGVIGMKIYGSGQWQSPEQRKGSINYALSNQLVDSMTIGHVSVAQLDDTLQNMEAALRA